METLNDVRHIQRSLCELHKLLTDLPDDMLEDSRDCSSPEPEESPSHSRPPVAWTQQMQWSDHHEENYQEVSDHRGQFSVQSSGSQPWVPQGADAQRGGYSQGDGYSQGGYSYGSVGTEDANDRSTEPGFPHGTDNPMEQQRNHVHGVEAPSDQQRADLQQVNYQPQKPPHPPQLDHLQRLFLHSTRDSADSQQLVQLQVLHAAQQRQMEDLEKKLEDSQRNGRCLLHQFSILKDEKEGLAVSLQESSRMVEEAKDRELQLNNSLQALELQLQKLTERDLQNVQKLRAAEVSMDSMKLQMSEMCRSDTLSRTREQHQQQLSSMQEQSHAKLLALSQRLDATSQALKEQTEVNQRLKVKVHQLEQQREEEQLERSKVINTLNQRLEESQRQCGTLLESGSVQEMNQMQAKLQQAQKAKTLSENMSHSLQEDLSELKEQITLYESALKNGLLCMETNGGDWEKHLSESYVDLGIKKSNWKNNTIHSAALTEQSEDSVKELRAELQRCLLCLKGKRQKICHLQDQLHRSEEQTSQLQEQLHLSEARVSQLQTSVDDTTPQHPDVSVASKKDLLRLQQDKQLLQEQVEELRQSEENLKSVNAELCSKMRQMIQELDQEKQEDQERYERTQQQFRNDVVNRVRTQLLSEHKDHLEQMSSTHQQQLHKLQTELSEASDRLTATQEDYVSVCKEKDQLETKLRNEKITAVQQLRSELEAEHLSNLQVHLASARTTWEEQHMKMERTSVQAETQTETTESREEACQMGGGVSSVEEASQTGGGVSPEDMASALCVQRQQLLLEAEKTRSRAVEEARVEAEKTRSRAVEEARLETRRDLQHKYLEDMTSQVEGALTRAYSRWLEDLTSLPEYKEHLQREKEQWTEQHQRHLQQQVSEARRQAEEECETRLRTGAAEEQQRAAGSQKEELQHHMARLRTEQEVLMKAQLAEARASWSRERQQEVSRLQEQLRLSEEQGRRQQQEEEQRSREKFLLELRTELTEMQKEEDRSSSSIISSVLQTAFRELLQKAKRQWRTVSEDRLGRVLKETQEHHESDIRRIQNSVSQTEKTVCGPRCAENTEKLQQKSQELHQKNQELHQKNQELQRHLEKACRQLQLSVRHSKAALQKLKDDHEENVQKLMEKHLLELDEEKSNNELSRQQNLERGLEEMKLQYHNTVERIRGDMLQYLQDSKQKAAQMIRMEVQKERQITARKMRHYYLSCLQDLLEEGGQSTGAEKKILSAASKLASMARVLETPVKRKPGKNHSLQGVLTSQSPSVSDLQPSKTPSHHQDMKTPSNRVDLSPSGREDTLPPAGVAVSASGRKPSRGTESDGKALVTTQQEAPVRDQAQGGRSSFLHPSLHLLPSSSSSDRRAVSPFSSSERRAVSAFSGSLEDLAAFGGLSPDSSDFTVYNQIIANVPTGSQHHHALKHL